MAQRLLSLALSVAIVAAGCFSAPADASSVRTQFSAPSHPSNERPAPIVSSRLHGRDVIDELGSRVGQVASSNGLTGAAFTSLFTRDHTAWLSREGRVFFQEDVSSAASTGTGLPTAYAPAYPTTQTFALHSRPGAGRSIFLDFDGATVSGTAWNVGAGAMPDGTHEGYDSDGSPSTFSTAEHGWIQEVWREVAESYSPFDVDVTTADPGVAGLTRGSASDDTFGTRVLVTSSEQAKADACGTCLGIAFLGVFDLVDPDGYYQPAWVFADDPTFDPMIVAQAAAHEAGHNLGLRHDGINAASYYGGTSAWGPVMGSSRPRAITQFSAGEYAGASNTEDDIAIMAANGLPALADDRSEATETAPRLGPGAASATGVISTRADRDTFALDADCTGTVRVTAAGIGAQTALDLRLDLLDPSGALAATSAPASGYAGTPPVSTGMDADMDIQTTAGHRYYLRVDGVGNGDPVTTGWSDYGSLGRYRIAATACSPASISPTRVTPPSAPRIGNASPGTSGSPVTATARWAAPTSTGGSAITSYRVAALRLDSSNRVVRRYTSPALRATARSITMRLLRGRYAFKVIAYNATGPSPWSSVSRVVRAR